MGNSHGMVSEENRTLSKKGYILGGEGGGGASVTWELLRRESQECHLLQLLHCSVTLLLLPMQLFHTRHTTVPHHCTTPPCSVSRPRPGVLRRTAVEKLIHRELEQSRKKVKPRQ